MLIPAIVLMFFFSFWNQITEQVRFFCYNYWKKICLYNLLPQSRIKSRVSWEVVLSSLILRNPNLERPFWLFFSVWWNITDCVIDVFCMFFFLSINIFAYFSIMEYFVLKFLIRISLLMIIFNILYCYSKSDERKKYTDLHM